MKTVEVAIWCWHNARGKAFAGYSFAEVLLEFTTKESAVILEDGHIIACATGEILGDKFRLRNVLATSPGGLRALGRLWKASKFGTYDLTASRNDIEVTYDNAKLRRRF